MLYVTGLACSPTWVLARGRYWRLLATWERTDVLMVDDFLSRPLLPKQAADVLEVIEDLSSPESTLLTSELTATTGHSAITEPALVKAVLDRLSGDLQHRDGWGGEAQDQPARVSAMKMASIVRQP